MTDANESARTHYGATGLTERLRSALSISGSEDEILSPEQLASLDQFHTLGLKATEDLAELANVTAKKLILDIGAGIGGPARFLAGKYGCRVHGIDLSEAFVGAARYLTARTAQTDRVSFGVGSALDLFVPDGNFDVAFLQHVAMNIADRNALYREIRRVIVPKGRFATFDVVVKKEPLYYPVPWARSAEASFLLTGTETREAIEAAGFRTLLFRDDTEHAKAWISNLRASGPPPVPNLGVVMGPDFLEMSTNLGRNLMDGRVGILTAIFEAI